MNIFVANLNFRMRGEELKDVFSQYGEVSSSRIITDKETRRSKGFGFVEMPNDSEARNAIEKLNGAEVGGRAIVVKEALPKEQAQ
jgi:RNA recognition motif-containing protein